ncbi:MAG TPA: hypothetical protein VE685_15960 [Thermoanaerobaculia bacterium]|nr:hypothetical protein [Thermoanaerobaculia bacterium]
MHQEDAHPDWSGVLSNTKVLGDPVTPVYSVPAGTDVRVRILMPGGHSRNIDQTGPGVDNGLWGILRVTSP